MHNHGPGLVDAAGKATPEDSCVQPSLDISEEQLRNGQLRIFVCRPSASGSLVVSLALEI